MKKHFHAAFLRHFQRAISVLLRNLFSNFKFCMTSIDIDDYVGEKSRQICKPRDAQHALKVMLETHIYEVIYGFLHF